MEVNLGDGEGLVLGVVPEAIGAKDTRPRHGATPLG